MFLPKTGWRKFFDRWKFGPRSVTTFLKQLSNEKGDTTIACIENGRKV